MADRIVSENWLKRYCTHTRPNNRTVYEEVNFLCSLSSILFRINLILALIYLLNSKGIRSVDAKLSLSISAFWKFMILHNIGKPSFRKYTRFLLFFILQLRQCLSFRNKSMCYGSIDITYVSVIFTKSLSWPISNWRSPGMLLSEHRYLFITPSEMTFVIASICHWTIDVQFYYYTHVSKLPYLICLSLWFCSLLSLFCNLCYRLCDSLMWNFFPLLWIETICPAWRANTFDGTKRGWKAVRRESFTRNSWRAVQLNANSSKTSSSRAMRRVLRQRWRKRSHIFFF